MRLCGGGAVVKLTRQDLELLEATLPLQRDNLLGKEANRTTAKMGQEVSWQHNLPPTRNQPSLMPLNFLFKGSNKSPLRLPLASARCLFIATESFFLQGPHI